MPVEHYENFPVASYLLPRRLVPAVEAIYAFARSADDIADEGDAPASARLQALEHYRQQLDRIERGATLDDPMFIRLAGVIASHRLPLTPFRDLLSAFSQDVGTTRYTTYQELLAYCARSANPVGLLMLHLYGAATPHHVERSNAICSALQLINFWQDVAIDWSKGRIYLPLDDRHRFGVGEDDIAQANCDAKWRSLMAFELERARALMLSGAPLAKALPGRIGWELRMVVHGGLRILQRIERADYDVFRLRPVLGPRDWLAIGWRALRM